MQTTPAQQGTSTLDRGDYAAFYLCSATKLSESVAQLEALYTKHQKRPVKAVSCDALWDGYWYTKQEAQERMKSLRDYGALLHYGCPAALAAAKAIEMARDARLRSEVTA